MFCEGRSEALFGRRDLVLRSRARGGPLKCKGEEAPAHHAFFLGLPPPSCADPSGEGHGSSHMRPFLFRFSFCT